MLNDLISSSEIILKHLLNLFGDSNISVLVMIVLHDVKDLLSELLVIEESLL
jgi:hypothetical protein